MHPGSRKFPDLPPYNTHTHLCAHLTYCREGHESLHKKASGWGELVGFLNQYIKAHLGKERTQKKMQDAARAHGMEGQNWRDGRREFPPISLNPTPR